MSEIPLEPQLTPEQAWQELQKWYETRQAATLANNTEKAMRRRLIGHYFPEAGVGTSRVPLNPGFELKLNRTLSYKVDEAALLQVTAEQVQALNLPMAQLFVQKWSLSVAAYNALTPEQRAFVDGLITVSDTIGSLEVVPEADREAQAKHAAAAEAQAAQPDAPAPKAKQPKARKAKAATPPEENPMAALVHLGKEETTPAGHYYRDDDGVWWLLKACGTEWLEVTADTAGGGGAAILDELESYWQSLPAAKRKRKG